MEGVACWHFLRLYHLKRPAPDNELHCTSLGQVCAHDTQGCHVAVAASFLYDDRAPY
jgi:hypothetical protein